jgi:PAS domain S-box-containing protein
VTEKNARNNEADPLRHRAEERIRKEVAQRAASPDSLTPAEAMSLLHDLRVHQIELEMQNDELRRTQAEVEASRERYFELYDLAPVGYLTVSRQGLIMEANLTVAMMLGLARGVLVDKPVSRLIAREDEDVYYLHLKQLFRSGAPQVFDLRLGRQDGTRFWARIEARVAQEIDGASVCRAAVSDITQLKREEEERVRLEHQLEQARKEESLGRMANAVAHHFNNLLGAVTGNLEMALKATPEGAAPRKHLIGAMQAARKAAGVSDLIRTYVGHSGGEMAPLDLSDVCRKSLPALHAFVPKELTLEQNLPIPGPMVTANLVQVQQVLTSLITNACEAMSCGPGTVRLGVTTVPASEISSSHRFPVDWSAGDPVYACLQVTDEGGGIPPEDIEKIFDPFFTTQFTGRGLGLPVVLGIVRAHGGAATVESTRGVGSAFRIYLPLIG